MSLQFALPSSLITESAFGSFIKERGLNPDGTLRIDSYLHKNIIATERRSRPILEALKSVKREVIAHAFLAFFFFIVACVPKPILRLRSILPVYLATVSKRALDVVGAVFGLVISTGLFFWLPLAIRLDSNGKAVFRQKRIGRDRRRDDRRKISLALPYERRKGDRRNENLLGKPFEVYKFRSMRENAEQDSGPIWAKDDDPRATRIGKIMRPMHLDEIPQFVNVLKGEMSLVGPRPERPEFISDLNKAIPYYSKRLDCKPGITGLAQISWRYDSTPSDVVKKLDYDLYYIQNRNMLFDILILLSTLKTVVFPDNHDNGSNGTVVGEKTLDAHQQMPLPVPQTDDFTWTVDSSRRPQ